MSALGNIGSRLYRGEVSVDFVGRQKLWYTISAVMPMATIRPATPDSDSEKP